MKGVVLVVVGLLGVAFGTLVLAPAVFNGIGAGVGVATGLKAGACLAVEGAKDLGFITPEQVDEVLKAAGSQLSSTSVEDQSGFNLSDAECMKVVQELRDAASK